eukprot:CAMPEP_0201656022 /NCGR_PEP_ID=MMETSP0493-20130528/46314_1 /ASSEMBLY_ACC=CAM_ASM_000838 /TAXON_ID=420259 /ORGANISM="Thalassiosira gravida, Strain GMp14c1" /LENGTH=167 /DNA_ID=CAMNT_0048132625 /DNA_START=491 /DNA_END=991 /DNA_ORIENTATION=-
MAGTGLREKVVAGEGQWGNFADLIGKMLSLDPLRRPSAQSCLNHPWLTSFCNHADVWKGNAHQSVVDELVPSFLQIANPIYISPPAETQTNHGKNNGADGNGDDQNRSLCGRQSGDPFAYAKHYASRLASSRRSFPQSVYDHPRESAESKFASDNDNQEVTKHNDRW